MRPTVRPSVRAGRLVAAASTAVLALAGFVAAAPVASGASGASAPTAVAAAATPYAPVSRVGGANRYEVAANAAGSVFAAPTGTAFVTSGEGFADALAAGASATHAGAPVFLTGKDGLPPATASALERYAPRKVTVVGGPGSVSEEVVAQLATSGRIVERVGGSDRYAVAAALATTTGFPKNPVVHIASGQTYSDALSATAAAGASDGPVLLVTATSVPAATLSALRELAPSKVVVVGGPATISESVVTTIKGYTLGANVQRVTGPDRYAVSAALSEQTFAARSRVVYLASGEVYPDALSAGPLAGLQHGPVLLTRKAFLPDVVRAEIARLQPRRIVLLGGTGSVSDAVLTGLETLTAPATATDISLGSSATCSVTSGEVECWGVGTGYGQLGTGAPLATFAPVPARLPAEIKDVSLGALSACALDADAAVWCWGRSVTSSSDPVVRPKVRTGLPAVTSVDVGGETACAVASADARVWCWGYNQFGELGAPGGARDTPAVVTSLTDPVVQVSVGQYHVCARTNAGAVWCWGANEWGQSGVDPALTKRATPTRLTLDGPVSDVQTAGNRTCVVLVAGGVRCWGAAYLGDGNQQGYSFTPVTPTGLDTATGTLSEGSRQYTCLVDGSASCWGVSPVKATWFGTNVAQMSVGDSQCIITTTQLLRCQGSSVQSGNPYGAAYDAPIPVTGY